jgi:hypothetical protein
MSVIICDDSFEMRGDVLEHIIEFHLDDTLPDVPVGIDDIMGEQDGTDPVLDPDDLEII